jgi:hypothetical protein
MTEIDTSLDESNAPVEQGIEHERDLLVRRMRAIVGPDLEWRIAFTVALVPTEESSRRETLTTGTTYADAQ